MKSGSASAMLRATNMGGIANKLLSARFIVSAFCMLTVAAAANAQPCNPIPGGPPCTGPKSSSFVLPSVAFDSPPSLANDLSMGQDRPATIGAITFRGGGGVCIGLLNRGTCN